MAIRAPGFHYAAFGLSLAYALLVFCQLTTTGPSFPSDLVLHVEFILHPEASAAAGYSLLHILGGAMLGWSGLEGADARMVASAAMLGLLVAACYGSLLAVYAYFRRTYPERPEWRVQGCTLAVFTVSMIVLLPVLRGVMYLGVFTPNPWHNPTYIFGRVFSILAFCQFVRLLAPEEKATTGKLTLLAAVTALSVWGKPSFLIAFLPAALAVLGWGALRGWFERNHALRMAATLVPSVLVLAWIDHQVFASGASSDKVIIAPGKGWGLYTPSFTMSIALGMLFPLFVIAVRGRTASRTLLTATLTWVASGAGFLLLAETGARALHANFAWCYMSGMFFMHLAAIADWFLGTPIRVAPLRWTGNSLFLLHLVSGLWYFLRLLGGGTYS